MKRLWFWLVLTPLLAGAEETRTWRAMGGFKTNAAFVKYEGGMVTLKKEDGTEVDVRLERLRPADRMEVIRLAGEHAHGSIPAGEIRKPEGRRELTWTGIVRGTPWPEDVPASERKALEGLRRGWKHAETRFFIVHYQEVGFAKRVGRMADFFYQYIAADLPGFQDRGGDKSHIVVLRRPESWKTFLGNARSAPEWAAAFVRGNTMFLHDTGSSQQGAAVLAHEMSHLVLNRFFRRPPPLWLNEGLAEWYGNFGWKAFKGRHVNPEDGLGRMELPFSVMELVAMRGYPRDPAGIHRYYATSQQLVGMLKLRKDQKAFVDFLRAITVEGRGFTRPLNEVYGLDGPGALQGAFNEFLD